MQQLIVKCDNGFIATVRNPNTDELFFLHKHNGLSHPHHITGSLYAWWNFCVRLVHLGIAKEF